MINWSQPYERTDTEFEPASVDDPWQPIKCKHCEEPRVYHWQTADGKIWCVRNTEGKSAVEGK